MKKIIFLLSISFIFVTCKSKYNYEDLRTEAELTAIISDNIVMEYRDWDFSDSLTLVNVKRKITISLQTPQTIKLIDNKNGLTYTFNNPEKIKSQISTAKSIKEKEKITKIIESLQ